MQIYIQEIRHMSRGRNGRKALCEILWLVRVIGNFNEEAGQFFDSEMISYLVDFERAVEEFMNKWEGHFINNVRQTGSILILQATAGVGNPPPKLTKDMRNQLKTH